MLVRHIMGKSGHGLMLMSCMAREWVSFLERYDEIQQKMACRLACNISDAPKPREIQQLYDLTNLPCVHFLTLALLMPFSMVVYLMHSICTTYHDLR